MEFIHQQGFAHRDLKSKNVLYDKDTTRAKVTGGCTHCTLVFICGGVLMVAC